MKFLSNIVSFFKRKRTRKTVITKPVQPLKVKMQTRKTGKFWGVIAVVLLALFCSTVLALSLRGQAGNPTPTELNTEAWKDHGPLELSPERGRYALLYSLTEQKSYIFNTEIAKFATPDVGYHEGQYVSLFAPGVSYLAIPGYLAGKSIGLAQVGTFAVIAVFGLFNFLLIRVISMRLGATSIASTLGAMAFLFASPAFAYAVTLYQHHVSTFLILASIFLIMRSRSVLSLLAIWTMCGISIAVDYPNFFMMLPIGLVALARSVVIEKAAEVTRVSLRMLRLLAVSAIILPLTLFLSYNNASYGSPFTLSGSVERAIEIKPNGQPVLESEIAKKQLEAAGQKNVQVEEKNVGEFFNPRLLMHGAYTHFISLDRGMILYTPILLLGAAGFYFMRRNKNYLALFTAVVGANVVLYSMWGDPYGGWAFGSRYLIPTYAILGVSLAVLLTKWNRNIIFLILFFLMFSYSVGVNTLGAITSNRNPPQVEAAALEHKSGKKEEFTFIRNLHLLDENFSKSFVFQTYAKDKMSAWTYFTYIVGSIITVALGLLAFQTVGAFSNKQKESKAEVKAQVVQRRKEYYAV